METKINLDPIKIIYVESENGPQEAAKAFAKLEKNLSLKGRKFYGLISEEGRRYLASTTLIDGNEKLGFPIGEIPGGFYVRTKIDDWQTKLSLVISEFNKLSEKYEEDATKPRIEFYRSQKELFLLLPITTGPIPKGLTL